MILQVTARRRAREPSGGPGDGPEGKGKDGKGVDGKGIDGKGQDLSVALLHYSLV